MLRSTHMAGVRLAILAVSLSVVTFLGGMDASASSSAVEVVYDAAGNIVQLRRQSATGLGVTGFSPGSAAVGATVTIYGTSFSTTPASNSVAFNGAAAVVSASDSGSLSVIVPVGASTGLVSVTVGGVTAYSLSAFIVVVPGAPTVTSFSPSMGLAASAVSVVGANFDIATNATTAQLGGQSTATNVSSVTALTFSVPISSGSGPIGITTSGGSGQSTQDFLVVPADYAVADVISSSRITPNGAAVQVNVGYPGKHAALLFSGIADGHYTLYFSQLSTSPTSAVVSYKIFKPDNTLFSSGTFGMSGNRPSLHLAKLPVAGTYTVIVSPGVATLSSVASIVADPVMSVDGAAIQVALPDHSMTGRIMFNATAGQRIGFGIGAFALVPAQTSFTNFKVRQPDGSILGTGNQASCYTAQAPYSAAGNCDGEMIALATGLHSVTAETPAGYQAGFSIQASGDVTPALAVDVPYDLTLTRLGHDANFTFPGSVGDNLLVEVIGVTPAGEAKGFDFRVLRPNGTTAASGTADTPSWMAVSELGTLSTAGTYTIVIDPKVGAFGTARVAVKQGALLATTDTPVSLATQTNGESAKFRFAATAGQNLTVGVAGLAYVGASAATSTLAVTKPDGSVLATSTCSPTTAAGRCKVNLGNIAAGTYSVRVTPPSNVKITGTVALSTDLSGTLTAGVPETMSVTRQGQRARFTFSGTTGQSTGVEFAQVATTPSAQTVYLYVYKPDGNLLTSTSSLFANLANLPTTGTYTVLVDTNAGADISGRLTLDAGATVTVDGAAQGLATTVVGETVRFMFSGTTGARTEIGIGGLAYGSASSSGTSMYLYRPDGSAWQSSTCYTAGIGGCEMVVTSLPSTGTYSVLITPPAAVTLSGGNFTVSTPLTGSLTIGGAAQALLVERPAQTARFTFSGTTAQLLRLNWSSAVVTGSATVAVSILRPDGTSIATSSFVNGASGGLDIPTLPSTGTYTVVLDPSIGASASASLTLATR